MARTKVQSELIATNAISGTIIADGAITSTHLAANCVDSSELVTGSIDTIHIAANQVTATKIVTNGVLTRHISDDQITADKLANSINTDIATGVTANTTANAALPKAGGTMTGNVFSGNKTGLTDTNTGHAIAPGGLIYHTTDGTIVQSLNRLTDDGPVLRLVGNGTTAGSVGVLSGGLSFGTGTSLTTRMIINSSGNVGIGTSSPLATLDVVRGGTTGLSSVNARTALLVQNNLSNGTVLSINAKNTGYSGIFFGDQDAEATGQLQYDHTDDKFKFFTNGGGQNPLTLDASGNVGIGTTSPSAKLHITGTGSYNHSPGQNTTSDLIITSSEMTDNNYHSIMQLVSVRQSLSTGSGANGYLGFSTMDDSNGQGIRDAGRIAIVNENGASRNSATSLSFWTNAGSADTTAATEKMRIDSSGKVKIGNTGGSGILNVNNGATDGGYVHFANNVGSTTLTNDQGLAFGWNKSNGGGESYIIGNQGAGSTGGLIFATNTSGGSYSEKLIIGTNGYLVAQSASQVRLVLGSTGNSSNNTSNWIRGTGNELGLNSAGGNIGFEIGGSAKMTVNATGQITGNALGISTPTFSFIADPNTGMTRPTTDTLQFVTGGVERLRLGNGQMLVNDAATDFNAGKLIVYGGGSTGMNGGTVHYNGPSREYRNVVSVHTANSASRYWHIKTNFYSTNNIMFVARVHGYSYGNAGHIVDIQRSGYAYAAHGQLTGSQTVNNGSGADTLDVYFSSDNYVCFRHSTPSSGYYNGYSFDIKMNAPTGYNWNFEVQDHAINSTSGSHF